MNVIRLACLGLIGLWTVWSSPAWGAEIPPAFPGITEPILDVMLSSSVAGIISRQNVIEGETVKKGQVILELDKELEELEVTRRKLVEEIRRQDLDATEVLFKKTTGVPKEEVDKKRVDYQVAVVEHQMAEEQLLRRRIVAPFSGTISDLALDEGEACEAYQPLVRLVDTQRCYFVSNIEAKAGALLKLDQTVTVEIETGLSPVRLEAKIVYLAPVVDPSSGLLKIKAVFDNSEAQIRPGLAGRVYFQAYAN